jgi:hypothetical protein
MKAEPFGPKAVAILLEAFDAVVAELDLSTNADKERAAKIIIPLALGQKDLDAAKLRESAIIAVRKENGTRRRQCHLRDGRRACSAALHCGKNITVACKSCSSRG